MADLADLSHWFGEDLEVTPTGDIATATTVSRTAQRVVRRLFTAATTATSSDYPWEPDYGVGLGGRIGDVLDRRLIAARVRGEMLRERSVGRNPPPTVEVTTIQGDTGVVTIIDVTYTDLSGAWHAFSFDLDDRTELPTPPTDPYAPPPEPSTPSPISGTETADLLLDADGSILLDADGAALSL
jgi:hypothetical protein